MVQIYCFLFISKQTFLFFEQGSVIPYNLKGSVIPYNLKNSVKFKTFTILYYLKRK